ncbi:hypothetical protein HPB50_003392 [Hyalomma asiaticum]|uniref:Uncharacterized protein n=1 Tax=Hyalomma asiaticum TaxID=266040 RepID=A0ACB7RU20_HYAAI|nr:hypothetical protein HPB50_003392 [Hyalomma asiaticum]
MVNFSKRETKQGSAGDNPDEILHRRQPSSGTALRCYLRSRSGHLASQCMKASRKTGGERPTAGNASACVRDGYIELKDGHRLPIVNMVMLRITGDLPVVKGRVAGKNVKVLRAVYLVDRSVRTLPEARIDIHTPYYRGEVVAACMEDPLFDLILGNIEGAQAPADPDGAWSASARDEHTEASLKTPDQVEPPEIDPQPQTIAAVTTRRQAQQQAVPTVKSLSVPRTLAKVTPDQVEPEPDTPVLAVLATADMQSLTQKGFRTAAAMSATTFLIIYVRAVSPASRSPDLFGQMIGAMDASSPMDARRFALGILGAWITLFSWVRARIFFPALRFPFANVVLVLLSTLLGRCPHDSVGSAAKLGSTSLAAWMMGMLFLGNYIQTAVIGIRVMAMTSHSIQSERDLMWSILQRAVKPCLSLSWPDQLVYRTPSPFGTIALAVTRAGRHRHISHNDSECYRMASDGAYVAMTTCGESEIQAASEWGLVHGEYKGLQLQASTMRMDHPLRYQHRRILLAVAESGLAVPFQRRRGPQRKREDAEDSSDALLLFCTVYALGVLVSTLALACEIVLHRKATDVVNSLEEEDRLDVARGHCFACQSDEKGFFREIYPWKSDMPLESACNGEGAKVFEAVNELVKRLPEVYSESLNRESDWFPGVTLRNVTFTGLQNCDILGPVQSYCRGNDDLTLFELHCSPLSSTIDWSMCSGRNGTLVSTIRYARMTVEFFIEHVNNGTDVRLVSAGTVAPSELTGVALAMTGSSEFLQRAVAVLGGAFSEAIREMWLGTLPGYMLNVLHDVKRKRQGV